MRENRARKGIENTGVIEVRTGESIEDTEKQSMMSLELSL